MEADAQDSADLAYIFYKCNSQKLYRQVAIFPLWSDWEYISF